ncbi:family 78 glycoside hydrolase catalytic domain [Paraflavisolibacter sp. H34]|uniref:family 78 glycoside hydrolase catalytic domain n=1 Tax=Huijunlia imazamoxiresistens TaxID=3127457 RepID=UPI0030184E9A
MKKTGFTLSLFFLSLIALAQNATLVQLKCDNQLAPLGVDAAQPSLSWEIHTQQRGYRQSAYQVIVSTDAKGTVPVWNSGRTTSSASRNVKYNGKALKSAQKYYWRVQVWDQNGRPSAWSPVATFTTGLFDPSDWSNAQWIGYEDLPADSLVFPGVHAPDTKRKLGPDRLKQRTVVPLFRKSFTVPKKVASALAFVSGLGHYELSLNGKKVGDASLAPGWTHYEKRVLYNTYDVTGLLQRGPNAIGAIVGNGFYNINRERYIKVAIAYGLPKLICKLLVRYTDGTTATITTDGSWKTAPSPITFTSMFGGEDYDAGLEQQGWDKPGFNDVSWKAVQRVRAPKGFLQSERDYPVKVNEVIKAIAITQPSPGIYVYDFGQNASGIVEIKVKGKKGQTVKMSPAELIHDDGLVNQNATGKPHYYSYTLKGEGEETWRPRFTYYGFRYVQVEGGVPDTAATANAPKVKALHLLHTGNSSPEAGTFACSNDLFNRINTLIKWAIKSNLQSVATDCPHREKLGWLEQDYLMGASIRSNNDIYLLYRKTVHDMMDAQTVEGMVPDIAPEFVFFDDKGFGFRDSPEWGSASVILPWLLYQWYGDKEIVREAFPMMQKYVAYLKSKSNGHLLDYGLGDWFDYGPQRPGVAQLTPKSLTATSIYYYDLKLLAQMATLIGDTDEAYRLGVQAAEVQQVFYKNFFNEATGVFSTGSQTAMSMPLCVGLVQEKDKARVLKNLVDSINLQGKKLTAGDIGFHFLVQALHEGGASQLLYDMNYRDDVPGYGFQLKKGATALTESWPALKEVSNNHLMLGHLMEWLYKGLAGINQSDSSVAYQDLLIAPEVVGDITWVKGSHRSPYGLVTTDWKKSGNTFSLKVEVPANSTATVLLPAAEGRPITEGGQPLAQVKEAKLLGYKDGKAMVRVGSGTYNFSVN